MRTTILLLLTIMLSGCATKPRTYTAPNATAMTASFRKISTGVDKAQQGIIRETALIKEAKTQGEILFRNAPVELKPAISELNLKVAQLESEHVVTVNQIEELQRDKAQFKIDSDKYQESAAALADQASAENAKRIEAETKLSSYRWKWFGSWIVFGLGLLACAFLAFLKFTGRLAIGSAAIASRL